MATTSNMQILQQGLTKISRELINKRAYDQSKITMVGTPVVSTEGVANNISATSYFQYDGLTFLDTDTVKVHFKGNFALEAGTTSCAWAISSTNQIFNPLTVLVTSAKVSFNLGSSELVSISNLSIENNSNIEIDVAFTSDSCSISVLNAGVLKSAIATISPALEMSNYTYVLLGNIKSGSTSYWRGSIDLPEFSIVQNNVMTYSPSTENIFNLSKILVSDGVYPLKNGSSPILNHVYEFPVTELRRSGGNILFMATIGSSIHLTINQVGLFNVTSEGDKLFALMDNLSIKKGKDIGYEIIFNLNIDLEVLNTNLYPTVVLTDQEYPKMSDFLIIKAVHANNITDMERAITNNAMEVGRNAAQTFCKLQDTMSLCESNCTGVRTYLKSKEEYGTELLDFFHIPSYKYSAYKVNNLNKSDSQIVVIDSALKGYGDQIDFSNTAGFTISLKVDLQDGEDKVILAKTDVDDDDIQDVYFMIELKNNILAFTLYLQTGSIVLQKQLNIYNLRSYTDNPFLLTIVKSSNQYNPAYYMYKNNTLIASVSESATDFLTAGNFPDLTNYVSTDSINEADGYLQGIYTFNGPLTADQLYYLTNITDTNFDNVFTLNVYPATGKTVSNITSLTLTYNGTAIASLSDFQNLGGRLKYIIRGLDKAETVTLTSTGYETESTMLLDSTINIKLTSS